MASGIDARRPHDVASTPLPSIESTSNTVPPLSDTEGIDDSLIPGGNGYQTKMTEVPGKRRACFTPEPKPYDPETYGAWGRKHYGEQWFERRNALLREGKSYLWVYGTKMTIPQPCDMATYDPDKIITWTPEPEPYDPKTYAAWGQKHFGDDWYEQRKIMLRERNFYMKRDLVYKERQSALTLLEHQVEGRPFRPRSGTSDEGWKRLWARLSKDMLPDGSGSNATSPTPLCDDSDLSGYDTYDPTPESREPTPLPEDPWELLEYNRRRFHYTEEEYQIKRIFLKEERIDSRRRGYEDEEGDRRREQELTEIGMIKSKLFTCEPDEAWGIVMEHDNRMWKFQLREEGWTQEQVDAEDRRLKASSEKRREERRNMSPTTKPIIPMAQEEMEEKRRNWTALGYSLQEQADMIELFGWRVITPTGTDQGAQSGVTSPPRASSSLQTKGPPHKTRSGRITKSAPTRKPRQRRERQRKTYQKERSSRRLAGQSPEFGMLPARGETPLPYQDSLPRSSNARTTSTRDQCGGRRGKKLTKNKGSKLQGISKANQHREARSKRIAK